MYFQKRQGFQWNFTLDSCTGFQSAIPFLLFLWVFRVPVSIPLELYILAVFIPLE